jgi:hypothetical protein
MLDYFENVVVNYLRSDRSIFVNTETCIQVNKSDNPDASGPHWYCDAVALDLRKKTIFLCEISYSKGLASLTKRLREWHLNWEGIRAALARDSSVEKDWPIRPWLFVPLNDVRMLLKRLEKIGDGSSPTFYPRITPLEMTLPWCFGHSWNREGEKTKPDFIPKTMRD